MLRSGSIPREEIRFIYYANSFSRLQFPARSPAQLSSKYRQLPTSISSLATLVYPENGKSAHYVRFWRRHIHCQTSPLHRQVHSPSSHSLDRNCSCRTHSVVGKSLDDCDGRRSSGLRPANVSGRSQVTEAGNQGRGAHLGSRSTL